MRVIVASHTPNKKDNQPSYENLTLKHICTMDINQDLKDAFNEVVPSNDFV